MNDSRLKKLFQFTDADLFANRQGRLSENQQKRLAEHARAEQKSARESAVILFVVAGIGLAFGLIFALTAPSANSRLFFILVLCVLWPLAWVGRAVKILREVPSMKEYQLQTARGRVHIIRHTDPSGTAEYVLQVGDLWFDVDGNPAGALNEGDECVVYYLNKTEAILSVEL